MLLHVVHGLAHHAQVEGLGERRILGAHAAHVDDALLEADDGAGGDHGHALEGIGLAAAHRVDLADDAGEDAALALDLDAGLDDVLDRGDAHGLAGLGDVEAHALELLLSHCNLLHVGLANVEHAALDLRSLVEDDVGDEDLSEFQLHCDYLPKVPDSYALENRVVKATSFHAQCIGLTCAK